MRSYTDVSLSVPNLNEGACVQGVSTLTFVFPAAENYADEKIFASTASSARC